MSMWDNLRNEIAEETLREFQRFTQDRHTVGSPYWHSSDYFKMLGLIEDFAEREGLDL